MQSIEKENTALLSKLTALLNTLRQCTGNKIKGPLLVDAFKAEPELAALFQLTYSTTQQYDIDPKQLVPNHIKDYKPIRLLDLLGSSIDKSWDFATANRECCKFLGALPKEYHRTFQRLLEQDFDCGVSLSLLNKALTRVGFEEVTDDARSFDKAEPDVGLVFYLHGTDYAHADIIYDHKKVGTASFVTTEQMRNCLLRLRGLGVKVAQGPLVCKRT